MITNTKVRNGPMFELDLKNLVKERATAETWNACEPPVTVSWHWDSVVDH